MGIIDTIKDKASDVALELAINGIAAAAKWIAHQVLGDAADDDDKRRIARAALDGAAAVVENIAQNRVAAAELPAKMRNLAYQIERDFATVFDPPASPTIPNILANDENMTVEIREPNRTGPYHK